MVTFRTLGDALQAGYRKPNTHRHVNPDRDVSGYPYFGYTYINAAGVRSVTVSLTEEINKIGRRGAFLSMFAPGN